MSLPTLFLDVQDGPLLTQISSLDELSKFAVTQSDTNTHWIDKLQQLKPNAAIVEISEFTSEDLDALSNADDIDDMDLIT